jgi:hypothetical protein
MHTYTSRALHVSVSLVESSLLSLLFISLAIVNLAIAVIKAFGSLLFYRRKAQLGICIATIGTSIPIVCLISLKRVDYIYHSYISITRTN